MHCNSPPAIIAIRSQSTSASSMLCVVKIIDFPAFDAHEKQKELNQLTSDFKKNMNEYQKEHSKPILTHAIELYKNTILPLQEENKNSKGSLKTMPKYIINKTVESIETQITYNEFKINKK